MCGLSTILFSKLGQVVNTYRYQVPGVIYNSTRIRRGYCCVHTSIKQRTSIRRTCPLTNACFKDRQRSKHMKYAIRMRVVGEEDLQHSYHTSPPNLASENIQFSCTRDTANNKREAKPK